MSGTSIEPKPGQLILWQTERMASPIQGVVRLVGKSIVELRDGTKLHKGLTWFGLPGQPEASIPDPAPEKRQPWICEKECFCCSKPFQGAPDAHYCASCIKELSIGKDEPVSIDNFKRPTKKRNCPMCKGDFQPTGTRQTYCKPCGAARMAKLREGYKAKARKTDSAPAPSPVEQPATAKSQEPGTVMLTAELNALSTRELIEVVLGRAKSIRLEIELN